MKTVGLLIQITALLLAVCSAVFSLAQEQSTSPQSYSPAVAPAQVDQQKVFVFVQRTDRHVKYSSAEMFQNVLNDLLDYLKTKNVAVAVDEFGGRNHAESPTPMDTIFAIARDAKASSVLYVVVDRPATKWLKITVQCFDMERKQLWQEEASSGGGFSGAHGFEVSTQKLHAELDKRVGQEDLPILAPAKQPLAAQ